MLRRLARGATTQRLARGAASAATRPRKPQKVLLHSCCAPCSGAMVEELVNDGHGVTIYFYNPNIHPREEYEIRKEENKRFASDLSIPFVDADYDVDDWMARAKGMEFDPERGRRCSMCFDMRMERTALYAHEHGFDCFTTTNATSRWKDQRQVHPRTSMPRGAAAEPRGACTAGERLGRQGRGALRLPAILLGVRLADRADDAEKV